MKKKVLVLTLLALFVLSGVVSAANLWGAYKGYAKVKVMVAGTEFKTTGVPPINFNGQIMIPLSVLKQLKIDYTWDSKKQTVAVIPIDNNYSYTDAVVELGFPSDAILTVAAKNVALDLLEIRKTKRKSNYSVQDALRELGLRDGDIPTLATLQQAVRLVSLH